MGAAAARRRATAPSIVAPATAPVDPVGAINAGAISFPCTAVSRCAAVITMPAILHPFPDIAVHVIQTP